MTGIFDSKRDCEFIAAGTHFFCQTCLVARPVSDRSPDPRYCWGCYDFLAEEAKMLPANKRPAWIPKDKMTSKKQYQVLGVGYGIMSTVKGQKTTVDINHPSVAQVRPAAVRGPKRRDLPEDLIRQLAGQGMGSKAIAARLKTEGIVISYKTIQRRLQGVLV